MKALCMAFCLVLTSLCTAQAADTVSAPFPPIQYDEISRAVLPGSTPAPPPDAFAADLSQARDGKIMTRMTAQNPMPQIAQPHFGFGDLFGAVFNPMGELMNIGTQMVVGGIMGAIMGGMMHGAANGEMESGRVNHYAYYQNFMRLESVADKKATIYDGMAKTLTELDLTKQQYKISPLGSMAQGQAATPPAVAAGNSEGSANITMTTQRTEGVDAVIGGVPATQYSVVTTIEISNGTGSCSELKMRMETEEYVAKTVLGPGGSFATFATMLTDHPEYLAGTGCAGKVTSSNSGPEIPPGHLVVYSKTLMTPEMAEMPQKPPQMWMVLERGNVKPVTAADATTLFKIPAGFAQQP